MKARFIIAAAALLVTSQAWSAPPDAIGQPLPAAPSAGAVAPDALPDWQSPVLDDLPASVIRDALARPLADEGALTTRGAREIGIYRAAAPSVVLIIAGDKKFGSGSYLGDGQILTNWHVVSGSRVVGILFKPAREGAQVDLKGLVRADVVKTDSKHDLALVRLAAVPPALQALELGSASEIQVGADVFAIGHPTGEAWTYTRGLISQIRDDYQWQDGSTHFRANVIQTQTPISPGSSGGPLLGESGKILGVNAFKSVEGENLNFAISVKDVATFLASAAVADAPSTDRTAVAKPGGSIGAPPRDAAKTLPRDPAKKCAPKVLYSGRNEKNNGKIVMIDTNCDGRQDVSVVTPDDKSLPITAFIDSNYDGRTDIMILDIDRDGRWDISYYDVDFDGKIDLVGYHPDGNIKASRFEKYVEDKSAYR
jgi:S1-C subfamily serine protease